MTALMNLLTGWLTVLLSKTGIKGPAAKSIAGALVAAIGAGLAYAALNGWNVEWGDVIAVMLGGGSGGGAGAYAAVDTRTIGYVAPDDNRQG